MKNRRLRRSGKIIKNIIKKARHYFSLLRLDEELSDSQQRQQNRLIKQQIHDYNVAAANQKRAKDKYDKEQDNKEIVEKPNAEEEKKIKDHQEEMKEEKEEMIQKDRALSRDIHQQISNMN